MPLSPGTRLASYDIMAALGAGGMGEVYRARDTKLGRDVAIKILPASFAQDADRIARFQREAQMLAAINHPHIAAIYGLEEGGGSQFLVLELVDGETLAARLERSRDRSASLPLDEVLAIARQATEALQAAHDKGIVHRDLKPANIALNADGHVKILDFGLAKAVGPAEAGPHVRGDGQPRDPRLSNSPTIAVPATMAGMILGTASYMSPEQAKGRDADKRTDVWAFGCVLFEMLTGQKAFDGEDATEIIAAVVRGQPDWTALSADTPASVRTLLEGCLEKDRRGRIGDMSTVLFVLKQPSIIERADSSVPAPVPPRGGTHVLLLAAVGTLAVALAVVVALWAPWKEPTSPSPVRLNAELGADVSLPTTQGPSAALSPDGKVLAFVAQKSPDGDRQLYVRRLDELKAGLLSGTDDAHAPFFSPDGQWLAFFAGGKLKKIAVRGGAAVTLCDAANGRGGSWTDDGTTIVFQPGNGADTPLWRVSSAGGKPEPLTALGGGEVTERWPQVLPGGKAVLYSGHTSTTNWDDARITVQALPKGPPKVLVQGGYYGRYLSSGHIVYIHEGTLFAIPFDVNRLEVTGQAVPVLEGVSSNPAGGISGNAQFATATNGTLVYLPGQTVGNDAPISWMTQAGPTSPLRAASSNWSNPRFSPDGQRLAVDIFDGKQADVWVYEWARDTLTRLTFAATDEIRPVWTPDGKRIVFSSIERGKPMPNLYWQKADGTGTVQRLTESDNAQIAASWHPSGKFLAFHESRSGSGADLMMLPMEGDEAAGWKPGKPTEFLSTPFTEMEPMFSPDGRWLAYDSDESGRPEVYVRPFPGPGGKWQISTDQGLWPIWSPRKPELFFTSPVTQRMTVASYAVDGASFRADKPRQWSDGQIQRRPRGRSADLHPDGQRFAVSPLQPSAARPKEDKLVFVVNFFDELKRIAPPAK